MREGLAGTFAALQVPAFRILWIGTLFSFVAFFMATVVNSVVAFELVGTNRAVGYVVFAQGLAMLLLGPLGGALADRWPKRRVVAVCQAFTAAVFLTLGLLVATGTIRVLFLALGSLLIGASFSFLGPARQALTVDLVSHERRGNAMALAQVAHSASRVLGPGLAGLLLAWAWFGAQGAYFTMAVFYLIAASSLALLPRSIVRADAAAKPVWADVAEGLRYVHGQRRLRLLVAFFVCVIMTAYPYVTVLPGLVENQLGRGAEAISGLYLVSAVGALGASLLTARFADTPWALRLYTGMGLCLGLSLVALSSAQSYAAALALMFVVGIGSGGFQALNGAVIVRETDPAYFGRVISLTILAFAGFGLMGLPIGLLADSVGERGALLAIGTGVTILVLGFTLALTRVPTETIAPAEPSAEPLSRAAP